MVKHLSVEKVVELNLLALNLIKVKKSDSAKVLSKSKIYDILGNCEEAQGDVFDKAVVLLKGLVQAHAFASGNRRTAFIATKYFLSLNGKKIGVGDKIKNARVMLGVREGFYSDEEIREWIKNGKIREFKR